MEYIKIQGETFVINDNLIFFTKEELAAFIKYLKKHGKNNNR